MIVFGPNSSCMFLKNKYITSKSMGELDGSGFMAAILGSLAGCGWAHSYELLNNTALKVILPGARNLGIGWLVGVSVPNVLGDVVATPVAGTAVFTINGQELRLSDLGGDPADGLFFVFNDPTKTETYPGGRFLETEPVVNERSCWTSTLQPRAQSTLRGNS